MVCWFDSFLAASEEVSEDFNEDPGANQISILTESWTELHFNESGG